MKRLLFWRRPRYVVAEVKVEEGTGEQWVRLTKASYDSHRISYGTILAVAGRWGRRVGGTAPPAGEDSPA